MSYSIEYRVFENSYFAPDEQWVTHSMKAGLTLKQADSQMYELDDFSKLQRRIVDSSGKIVAHGRYHMENTNIFRVESFENSRWSVEASNKSLDDAIDFVNNKAVISPKQHVVVNQNTGDKIYYGFHELAKFFFGLTPKKLWADLLPIFQQAFSVLPTTVSKKEEKMTIKLTDISKIHEAYTRLESLHTAVENLRGGWISKAEITLTSAEKYYGEAASRMSDQQIEIEHSVLLPILESEIKRIEAYLTSYGVSLC
jgi:hypothetical protein